MAGGLQSQPIAGFLGVNLRRDRLSLTDAELAKAINADLHTFFGSITRRLGTQKQFQTALGSALTRIIRTLAKINGVERRYRVGGRSVFRNSTTVGSEILSANLVTKTAPMRPLNDNLTWMFFADDAVMKKDDGTNFYRWGIVAPTSAVTVYQAGSGNLRPGVYSVKYTYARYTDETTPKLAHESNPSPVSSDLTITGTAGSTNHSILVTGVAESEDPQVNALRFYRTVPGGADWLFSLKTPNGAKTYGYSYTWEADEISGTSEFKFTIADAPYDVCFTWETDFSGSTTTSTSTGDPVSTNVGAGVLLLIADAALGTIVEDDNDPPPLASWCVTHDNTMFLCRDAENPHYLWWSKRFRPESWPVDNFLEVGNVNEPLVGAVSWIGLLACFSEVTKYRITGTTTAGFQAQESISRRGTPSPMSLVPTQHGIVFMARDGVHLSDMIQEDTPLSGEILPLFQGESVNDFEPINWNRASTISAAAFKRRLYVCYPSGVSQYPDKVMVYSVDTQKWYFYDLPLSSILVEEDEDQLVAGGQDGYVYVLEKGSDDAGNDISLDVETRDFWGQNPESRKLFRYFRVDCDCDDDSVTAKFYVDGEARATKTLTGDRTKVLQALPGSIGYSWRVRIQYTGMQRPKIYGVTALYLPLEEA